MKILFLDIDGVVNTFPQRKEFGMDFISPQMMKLVAKICHESDANIVLSSMWRTNPRDQRLVEDALEEADIIDRMVDKTPEFTNIHDTHVDFHMSNNGWTWDGHIWALERAIEIHHWVHTTPIVTKFAVLDDLPIPTKHLFQTHDDVGLTEEIACNVINHFMKG